MTVDDGLKKDPNMIIPSANLPHIDSSQYALETHSAVIQIKTRH